MIVEIRREDYRSLANYASIPISFDVHSVVDIVSMRVGDSTFSTRSVAPSTRKDYDALPGNDPQSWSRRFDVRNWIVLAAYCADRRVGGAIAIEDRVRSAPAGNEPTFATLWDLRVEPASRGRGVGRALIGAAEDAVLRAGFAGLEVETQDNNAPACRLYAACGYTLRAVTAAAYSDVPDEARIVWHKLLGRDRAPSG